MEQGRGDERRVKANGEGNIIYIYIYILEVRFNFLIFEFFFKKNRKQFVRGFEILGNPLKTFYLFFNFPSSDASLMNFYVISIFSLIFLKYNI